MIPYDVDPSLHNTEPHEPLLGDGFSPPNPSHLPVEPEFAPQLPPSDPDNPHPRPPAL